MHLCILALYGWCSKLSIAFRQTKCDLCLHRVNTQGRNLHHCFRLLSRSTILHWMLDLVLWKEKHFSLECYKDNGFVLVYRCNDWWYLSSDNCRSPAMRPEQNVILLLSASWSSFSSLPRHKSYSDSLIGLICLWHASTVAILRIGYGSRNSKTMFKQATTSSRSSGLLSM